LECGAARFALTASDGDGGIMFTLGVVFLLLGFLLGVPVLWTLGVILLVVGAVLWLMGAVGHEVGGRRHYY
jgi:fatty acid desaturase